MKVEPALYDSTINLPHVVALAVLRHHVWKNKQAMDESSSTHAAVHGSRSRNGHLLSAQISTSKTTTVCIGTQVTCKSS